MQDPFSMTLKAGKAFGSGAHPTTEGMLAILTQLKQQGYQARQILDMGAGSGVLSIAAAALWQQSTILAADINADAPAIILENAEHNQLDAHITPIQSDGYKAPIISQRAPYDLILCNILVETLIPLAKPLHDHLAPNGIALLSGILRWQEADVIQAHEAAGLKAERIAMIEDWVIVMVRREANTSSPLPAHRQ